MTESTPPELSGHSEGQASVPSAVLPDETSPFSPALIRQVATPAAFYVLSGPDGEDHILADVLRRAPRDILLEPTRLVHPQFTSIKQIYQGAIRLRRDRDHKPKYKLSGRRELRTLVTIATPSTLAETPFVEHICCEPELSAGWLVTGENGSYLVVEPLPDQSSRPTVGDTLGAFAWLHGPFEVDPIDTGIERLAGRFENCIVGTAVLYAPFDDPVATRRSVSATKKGGP